MRYDYRCDNCSNDNRTFIFEVIHGMQEKPSVSCPRCKGTNTQIAFLSVPVSYIRGNGWLDKEGRRRDMHLWKLKNDDPYANMRERGEADDMATRLRRGGMFNKKQKHFQMSKVKKP